MLREPHRQGCRGSLVPVRMAGVVAGDAAGIAAVESEAVEMTDGVGTAGAGVGVGKDAAAADTAVAVGEAGMAADAAGSVHVAPWL